MARERTDKRIPDIEAPALTDHSTAFVKRHLLIEEWPNGTGAE